MATSEKAAKSPHRIFAETWRTLRRDVFSSYRPELHYMRGPGPKWREKHAAAKADLAAPETALANGLYARS
jgi:hypothetical protein